MQNMKELIEQLDMAKIISLMETNVGTKEIYTESAPCTECLLKDKFNAGGLTFSDPLIKIKILNDQISPQFLIIKGFTLALQYLEVQSLEILTTDQLTVQRDERKTFMRDLLNHLGAVISSAKSDVELNEGIVILGSLIEELMLKYTGKTKDFTKPLVPEEILREAQEFASK